MLGLPRPGPDCFGLLAPLLCAALALNLCPAANALHTKYSLQLPRLQQEYERSGRKLKGESPDQLLEKLDYQCVEGTS